MLWDGCEPDSFLFHQAFFSPDGKLILTQDDGGFVTLWDVNSGAEIWSFDVINSDGAWGIGFSPDGTTIAIAGQELHTPDPKTDIITLWSTESGEKVKTLDLRLDDQPQILYLAFSPDGRMLLTTDKDCRLWNIDSGCEEKCFSGDLGSEVSEPSEYTYTPSMSSACFSPDSKFVLAPCVDNTVRLWDIESGREIRRFEGHSDYVGSVQISADGRIVLTGSSDNTVRLWDNTSGVRSYT